MSIEVENGNKYLSDAVIQMSSTKRDELEKMLERCQALDDSENKCNNSGNILSTRPKTAREYDQHLNNLRKENFNLKLRLFLLEEKNAQCKDGHNMYWPEHSLTDSKSSVKDESIESLQRKLYEKENQHKELENKLDFLYRRAANKDSDEIEIEAIDNSEISEGSERTLTMKQLIQKVKMIQSQYDKLEEKYNKLVLINNHPEDKLKRCLTTTKFPIVKLSEENLDESKVTDCKFDQLQRQLSISEDNVNRLLKILETKDKLLEFLLRRCRESETSQNGIVANSYFREEKINFLKNSLLNSETKLINMKKITDDVKNKGDKQQRSEFRPSKSTPIQIKGLFENVSRPKKISVERYQKALNNHIHSKFKNGEDLNLSKNPSNARLQEDSVGDCGDICHNQVDGSLCKESLSSSEESNSTKTLFKSPDLSNNNNNNNNSKCSEVKNGSILFHKTKLSFPVSVQLVIDMG
ncbi:CDK5 regulatory subunit-associated protein 2-like [Centruroides sculpturatus]|uniref:CDK5 regulatory subunit-associated protein 2-like n=1 Tax=Centruroides sculpturatus TaxID=218467 RepID=UPI000C6ED067|nr:CDK5 regulatory subunit-associated protein 2-like [Centruroides sculpturatus]